MRLTASAQTFLLLRAAEAAGSFLELIAVNFDHPKRAEHLRQVGSFITADKLLDLNTFVPNFVSALSGPKFRKVK